MYRTAGAVVLLVLFSHVAAQEPVPKKKSDLDAIIGTWWIVGLENGGKTHPEKTFRGNTFSFGRMKGANIATLAEGKYTPVEFGFSLDPTRTPKSLDLVLRGNTVRGIYKLEGDDLTICMSLGGPRPTDFATRAAGDTETFTLKRSYWERYIDKTFGFSVEFPGKPIETRKETETGLGLVTSVNYLVRSDVERLTYSVIVVPVLEKLAKRESDAVLDWGQEVILDAVAASTSAKLEVTGKPFKPQGGVFGVTATREFSIVTTMPDSKERGAIRVRVFLVGDRLIALAISGAEDATRSQRVGLFWGSFRHSAGKK